MATGNLKLAPHIKELLGSAQQELQQLNREGAVVVKRICIIKRTLVGLAELFGENVLDNELCKLVHHRPQKGRPGLTAVCREILVSDGRALTTVEVYKLVNQHFPALLANHKVPLSWVATVLNRLAKYGEAQSSLLGRHRTWKYVQKKRRAA
jgi:hypothetical protein